jgi:peptide/nickel transport system permease protein
VLFVLCIVAIFAEVIAPYDRDDIDLMRILEGPSRSHFLGTDDVGRDIFSRLIHAGRVSLGVGVSAMGLALLIGVSLGSIAGFYGGWLDNLIMRLVDIMLSIPIFFLLLILATFGLNPYMIVIIIGCTSWMGVTRLVRASFLSLREKEFVEASRAIGASHFRIAVKQILPNAIGPILVAGTLGVADAILIESALSFLGFGIQPPTPSWGNMLTNAQEFLFDAPWIAFYPGLMIFVTVLSLNFVGDGLRDALEPRLQ